MTLKLVFTASLLDAGKEQAGIRLIVVPLGKALNDIFPTLESGQMGGNFKKAQTAEW